MFNFFNLFSVDETLLDADIPIMYGEEKFIQRINNKSDDSREPIGLVLSGGSARAMAHIGVLKYLEENGIVPDFVVSNSMGSIIALLYGAGFSPDQIYELFLNTSLNSLFDLSLPLNSGMLNVNSFISFIAALIPKDLRLEDLKIPVMVVCEDLVSKRQVLLCEGDFLTALKAGFALPFYFSSVKWERHRLIDGGIANICPLSLAYRYTNKNIISTTFYASDKINLKNPLSNLNVSFDIGKRRQAVKDILAFPSALWIRCNVEDISFMKFEEIEMIKTKGYESAKLKAEEVTAFAEHKKEMQIDLKQAREKNNKIIENAQKKYAVYKRLPRKEFSHFLTIGGDNSFYRDSVRWLRNDIMLGLNYSLQSRYIDISIFSGVASTLYSAGGEFVPSFRIAGDTYIPGNLKLSLESTLFYKTNFRSFFDAMLYGHQSLEFRWQDIDKGFCFSAGEYFEIVKPFKNVDIFKIRWNEQQPLLRLDLMLAYKNDFFDSKNHLGSMFLGTSNLMRYFIYFRSDMNFKIPSAGISFGLKNDIKYALDGKGCVPFFISDTYNTVSNSLLNQGLIKTSEFNDINHLIASGVNFKWSPNFMNFFSIAEAMTVKNTGLELYSNFLWHKKSKMPAVDLGGGVFTNVSLLGLKNINISTKFGYEFETKKMIWQIIFSNN